MKQTSNELSMDTIKAALLSGTAKQLIFMVGIAISVALGIVLYMSIQEPIYRPLDYQVTSQNMASIVDTLEKSGIQYKVNDRDGVILVSAKDVQVARMKLASAGIPKDDSINYSFLNDKTGLGSSQFLENARYLRALENDLSKTISAIEGVSGARVHIAKPQNTVFADESGKTTASVMLSVSPGFASSKEKIQAIIQIVAGSVPGLDPKDVAITDQYGHYLSAGLDPNSIFNAEQLNYQNNIQNYYEKRIETMISPILGENKVSVRVYADIDFTQQEEAQEQYDPDKKVLRSEQVQTESVESSAASGTPGSLSNSPPSEDSDKPASSGSTGGSQGRSESTKNYELTKSVSYKKSNAAKVKSLSVAVVVDNEVVIDPKTKQPVTKPLDPDKIAKITQLVQATIGYDQARGDKVTVVNSGFTPVKQEIAPAAIRLWEQPWFWDIAKKIIGILLGFIFLFVIYRRLSGMASNKYVSKGRPAKVIEEKEPEEATPEEEENSRQLEALKQERISQLKQFAATDPNRVALIIKNWVGK